MKLLPRPPKNVRVNTDDSLGHGMDAVITLVIFLGVGFGLDRLFGTMPVFMIAMTVLGAVGLFARFYYQYAARMDEHDQRRLAKLAGPAGQRDSNGEAA
jgi:ATP synthase protein I